MTVLALADLVTVTETVLAEAVFVTVDVRVIGLAETVTVVGTPAVVTVTVDVPQVAAIALTAPAEVAPLPEPVVEMQLKSLKVYVLPALAAKLSATVEVYSRQSPFVPVAMELQPV